MSAIRSLGIACTSCIMACRPTEKPTKEASIWIGMLSLNTSTKRPAAFTDRQPVISVDTKKKELVGNFKNAGREWSPKGAPQEVDNVVVPAGDLGEQLIANLIL